MTLDDAGATRSATRERDLPPAAVEPDVLAAERRRWTPVRIAVWVGVALLGGLSWVMLAIVRGRDGQRDLVRLRRGLHLPHRLPVLLDLHRGPADASPDDRRATPAEYKENGQDYVPTDRRVLYGHHFAAIAGAGPLVGPVLAAQWGYLPGTIWIIVGVILAGAVQDYLVMFFSMRRGGRSLGQMARDQLGRVGGIAAMLATLTIMIIIVAILALVVVNALGESPWGVFSRLDDHPDRPVHGRLPAVPAGPGKVSEVSIIGFALLMAAIIGGGYVAETAWGDALFTLDRTTIAWGIIVYGFVAAVLPVWLLLAPRDYLSTFMKIGTIVMLAVAIVVVRPEIAVPAVSEFAGRPAGGPGGHRAAVPVPVRDDRLRRAVRLPRPDLVRHHAEARREGAPDPPHRLRRHAHGVVRRDHGARRRPVDRPRHLLRDERLGRRHRRHHRDAPRRSSTSWA